MVNDDKITWYEDSDRSCSGDDRYTDMVSVKTVTRARLAMRCASCPVYYECLDDLLSRPKWTHYGIQAGIIGRA